MRYFHDFFVTYDPTKQWKLAAAFDTGWQGKLDGLGGYDNWQGGALIVRRRLWERAGLVGRVEYFRDPSGVQAATHAGGLRTTGYSLGFVPVPRVILRAEVKEFVDQSNAYRKGKAYQHTNAAVTTLLGLTFWSS